MPKFLKTLSTKYSELDQVNPIRWEILYKQEDGVYAPQTGKFKCKDFFNEIVAKIHGHSLPIYGFDPNKIKVNNDFVYLRIKGIIKNPDRFVNNFELMVNAPLREHLNLEIKLQQLTATSWFLPVPIELFKSTYRISLLSLLIRYANTNVEFKDFNNGVAMVVDNISLPSYSLKHLYTLPEDKEKYWYYSAPQYNSEKAIHGIYIHANGIQSWSLNLPKE